MGIWRMCVGAAKLAAAIMITYWAMFGFAALVAVLTTTPRNSYRRGALPWLFVFFALSVLIGLRHEVGGDWANYLENFFNDEGMSLAEALQGKDFGFQLLTWLTMQLGGDVYLLNFFCGILFAAGLVVFCRAQPRPWLALTVAVPYLVIVVAMGYTRQGVAIGLTMLGMVALSRKHNWLFVAAVIAAATMHKSAIVLLPLAILATPRRRVWTALWAGVTIVAMYYALIADTIDTFVTNYVEAAYSSEGAAVRIAMNVLPALILLVTRRRLSLAPAERNLWVLMAILAIACVAWLTVAASSTAVDRLALYLIPLQLFVCSRLPELLTAKAGRAGDSIWVYVVVIYYAAVQFVWLNFAIHASGWLPYRSWLFL